MHILGPQPNGKNDAWPFVAFEMPSENLLGLNCFASHPTIHNHGGLGLLRELEVEESEEEIRMDNKPTSKSIHRSVDRSKRAELQSTKPNFAPRMNIKQDKVVVRQNEEKVPKVVGIYEKRLKKARFLAGDEFSLADLSHLSNT
ncbi:glutathione s-transferase f10 [Quercus suber]|uniref:glutathione transferase n=1 Tax=Quercus suber TaxID=58331 RepID=A0AAW0LHA4_QUESU